MSNKIGWIIAGVVACVLVIGGGTTALVLASGGDPTTVQEVADAAVDAAEDLDLDAGIDLLCDSPSREDVKQMEELIEEAQKEAGTDDPDVTYAISDVEGEREGSFRVTITSDEEAFEDERASLVVQVEKRGDRSCIADAEGDD